MENVYKLLAANFKTIERKESDLFKAKKLKGDKENELSPITIGIKAIDDKLPKFFEIKAIAKSELESANNILPEEYRSNEVSGIELFTGTKILRK